MAQCLSSHWQHVVAIPARDEPLAWFDQLTGFLGKIPDVLAIVVINQPSPGAHSPANHALYQRFAQVGMPVTWPPSGREVPVPESSDKRSSRRSNKPLREPSLDSFTSLVPTGDTAALLCRFGASHALVLDRYKYAQISPKEGVGKARKIAADIALALYEAGQLSSGWVHCTDADVSLPADYFQIPAASAPVAAMLYPFRHVVAAGQSDVCIRLYEQRLQYYVDALRWAGSGYAYHTVGSTLAINLLHYARVRGFAKRAAGEDFHVLNKLAKTGDILALPGPQLLITHRHSNRVPFGTGQAVRQLEETGNPHDAPVFEHPDAIAALREVLAMSDELRRCGNAERAWKCMARLPPATVSALDALGFQASLRHAFSQSRHGAQWRRHLHTRFDALATLRFLHLLAREQFPNVSWCELRRNPPPFGLMAE